MYWQQKLSDLHCVESTRELQLLSSDFLVTQSLDEDVED